jgi:hypothetical protein
MFELTGPLNRVVIPHTESKVTLLGARIIEGGKWIPLDDAKKILRAVASGRLEKQLKDGALPSPRTRVALQRVVDAVQRSALKRAIEIGKQKRQWTGRQERELSALEANRISGRKR